MNWIQRIEQILEHPLFQLAGEPVTLLQTAIILSILAITFIITRLVRQLFRQHLLGYFSLQSGSLNPLIRITQLIVWGLGLFASLKVISIAERAKAITSYPLLPIGGQPLTPMKLAVAALTIIITIYVARSVRWLCEKRLERLIPVQAPSLYPLVRLTQYAIWVVGFLIGLKLLNIDLTGIAVLAGALGVGIGFGLQNITSNFVAGLILLFERPIKVSDFVTVQDVEGTIVDINPRATTVVTNDNISIIVPNSQFINSSVINWSHGEPNVRISLPVGVAYGSDVDLVTGALLEVAGEARGVLKEPPPGVFFMGFGDSSLNFELRVWTDQPIRHEHLRSRLNYAIDGAFRRHHIHIPFPQRDVHVKTADGDGKGLGKAPAR